MSQFNAYMNKKISVITVDGRTLVGMLFSADNNTNLVLQNCVERVIRPAEDPEPSVVVPLGLYIVRGDNVCLVGLVDEDIDNTIDWTAVKGASIGTTKHT